ncbi:MAG: signal recognition particle-docking protein FtsY [Acidimicrobiaceae bacterium]|nr:signal recognition particle-docking protein FtsY [Acidimicrobiaceae bacterium]
MWWWIVLALVVVVALVLVVRRRRRRTPVGAAVVARAPMPDVLVEQIEETPSLVEEPTFAQRLGASRSLFERVRTLGVRTELGAEQLNVVEEVLLRSDVGVLTTDAIVKGLRESGAPNGVAQAVREELLSSLDRPRDVRLDADEGRVPVWLFVGVNGVGKTTSIGKLAFQQVQAGRRVLLAAGDTFRAAAADQLAQWAERTGADLVRADEGADPGSVVHDALGRAEARGVDLVLADTAGRRVNSSNLIDELAKIRRVADRGPGQVVETFMVLDATTGQNALSQAREFLAAAQVSGIILTKLDGTARGGIVVAIERELGIPVKFVGVGERAMDLVVFDPDLFVDSLLGTSG